MAGRKRPPLVLKHAYNTRSKRRAVESTEKPGVPQVPEEVPAAVQGRIVYDPKNVDKFILELTEATNVMFLDISALRGNPRPDVEHVLMQEIHKAAGLKIGLSENPDFGLTLLEKAKAVRVLEVAFIRRTKADDQRRIIHHLLNMELKSLLVFGTFTAKFDPPQQPFSNKNLNFLRCPTVPKNNEFVKVLIAGNRPTLRYVFCGDNPQPRDLTETAECKELSIVSVETFKDLYHMKELPTTRTCIMVRGSPKETADEIVDVVLDSPDDGLLTKIQYLSVTAQDRLRMHHALMAISLCCIKLKGLFLHSWRGDVSIRGVLKRMPLLKSLRFEKCTSLDINILEDMISNSLLPNLRKLILVRTTWHPKVCFQLYLDRLSVSRPNIHIEVYEEGDSACELTDGKAVHRGLAAICL